MATNRYIMENEDEIERLELKTDSQVVIRQAQWAGLAPGHRAADIGCGTGKTTAELHKITGPTGEAVGIDISADRIAYARKHYGGAGLRFVHRDFVTPIEDIGTFDFIWVRFILEYFGSTSRAIIENLSTLLRPGGILCLIDLDNNCLCHYGFSERLTRTIEGVMRTLTKHTDFDPYAGRKLYRYLYDMKYTDIDVHLSARHLIFGPLNDAEAFNWRKKIEVAARQSGYPFEAEYPGGYDEFFKDFTRSFSDEARFAYTPMIACRGRKPKPS
ncbi:MAG: methyltransferase domain-containing protein [Pseudomonadota bacterium]